RNDRVSCARRAISVTVQHGTASGCMESAVSAYLYVRLTHAKMGCRQYGGTHGTSAKGSAESSSGSGGGAAAAAAMAATATAAARTRKGREGGESQRSRAAASTARQARLARSESRVIHALFMRRLYYVILMTGIRGGRMLEPLKSRFEPARPGAALSERLQGRVFSPHKPIPGDLVERLVVVQRYASATAVSTINRSLCVRYVEIQSLCVCRDSMCSCCCCAAAAYVGGTSTSSSASGKRQAAAAATEGDTIVYYYSFASIPEHVRTSEFEHEVVMAHWRVIDAQIRARDRYMYTRAYRPECMIIYTHTRVTSHTLRWSQNAFIYNNTSPRVSACALAACARELSFPVIDDTRARYAHCSNGPVAKIDISQQQQRRRRWQWQQQQQLTSSCERDRYCYTTRRRASSRTSGFVFISPTSTRTARPERRLLLQRYICYICIIYMTLCDVYTRQNPTHCSCQGVHVSAMYKYESCAVHGAASIVKITADAIHQVARNRAMHTLAIKELLMIPRNFNEYIAHRTIGTGSKTYDTDRAENICTRDYMIQSNHRSSLYQPGSIEIMYLKVSPVNANIIGVSALLILVSLLCALCCGAIARRAFFRFSCVGSGSTNSSSRASSSSTSRESLVRYVAKEQVAIQFTLGLRANLQAFVQAERPQTLDNAIALAIKFENLDSTRRPLDESHYNKSPAEQWHDSQTENASTSTDTVWCNHCNKSGHIYTQCWTLARQMRDINPSNGRHRRGHGRVTVFAGRLPNWHFLRRRARVTSSRRAFSHRTSNNTHSLCSDQFLAPRRKTFGRNGFLARECSKITKSAVSRSGRIRTRIRPIQTHHGRTRQRLTARAGPRRRPANSTSGWSRATSRQPTRAAHWKPAFPSDGSRTSRERRRKLQTSGLLALGSGPVVSSSRGAIQYSPGDE
ncbi:unnamed protein product, partial [Trichogramma brassicae]